MRFFSSAKNCLHKLKYKLRIFVSFAWKCIRKTKWWVALLLLAFLITTFLIFTPYSQILKDWAILLTEVLTPISIILGIVLGYPLLSKKLTEQHILKQFEIMDAANRSIRHKVINILDKHKPINIDTTLTPDYVKEVFDDIIELKQCALDATPDTFRYTNLIYKAVASLHDTYSEYTDKSTPQNVSKRCLQIWLYEQLQEVYNYSKSIGVTTTGETSIKNILNKNLSPYVSNNSIIEIRDIAHSISYYHSDAMLVLFFGISVKRFSADSIQLFRASYQACPSASPFARLLLNNAVYFPPKIISKEIIGFFQGHFQLIGYKRKKTKNFSTKEESSKYICIYSNEINYGFCDCTVTEISSLYNYLDDYLGIDIDVRIFNNFVRISDCAFSIEISLEDAQEYFKNVKSKLEAKLLEEIK